MTDNHLSVVALLNLPSNEITLERIQALVDRNPPESLTLEFKEQPSTSLTKSVAAMANSYGGLIIVGVTDGAGPNRLVGIPEASIVDISNACQDSLEPPWQPEIIPIRIADDVDRFIVVLRVDTDRAPRPILIKGAAPIRLEGRNAVADRERLAQLFADNGATSSYAGRYLSVPQVPRTNDGSPSVDCLIRSGIRVSLSDAATWRPLSESAVDALIKALNRSALIRALSDLISLFGVGDDFTSFERQGFNRARNARLAWQAGDHTEACPVEAVVNLELPQYGVPRYGGDGAYLTMIVDVSLSFRGYAEALGKPDVEPWRIPVSVLYELLDALMVTLVDPAVRYCLAQLAGSELSLVLPPSSLDVITGPPITEWLRLGHLALIPDAGTSHGTNLYADPSLDLSDETERQVQIDEWMKHLALDSGLRGMEAVLTLLHMDLARQAARKGPAARPGATSR